jgi:Ca2+-binding RTX toxin-like protein
VPKPGKSLIIGTAGNDVIRATSPGVSYVVASGGGNDVVVAGSGNDYVSMAGGNDTAVGGSGDDKLNGAKAPTPSPVMTARTS